MLLVHSYSFLYLPGQKDVCENHIRNPSNPVHVSLISLKSCTCISRLINILARVVLEIIAMWFKDRNWRKDNNTNILIIKWLPQRISLSFTLFLFYICHPYHKYISAKDQPWGLFFCPNWYSKQNVSNDWIQTTDGFCITPFWVECL